MFDYDGCTHSVFVRGLCGDCGMPMDSPQASSVSMIHSVPGLKVSVEYARQIGQAEQQRLIAEKKLVLLVDLDQTLLHTTYEKHDISDPEIHSFNLTPDQPTFHTKLRPFLSEFLDEMVKLYELHIFTFGSRNYAHKIATIIDPDKKYFGDRILSRDESVDQYSKHGNLNNLFPCGDSMVCIIDDRADVWKDAANLIQVKPYSFFKTSISDGADTDPGDDDPDAQNLEDLLSDYIDPKQQKKQVELQKAKDQVEEREEVEVIPGVEKDQAIEEEGIAKLVDKRKSEEESDEEKKQSQKQAPLDTDVYLKELMGILSRIHRKWYEELEKEREFLAEGEHYKLPAIADIIRKYFRKRYGNKRAPKQVAATTNLND